MISKKLLQLMNTQIEKEFYSAYFYISMSAYCASKNCDGFSHWFYVQAKEECDHAQMIIDYIVKIGAAPQFQAIESPPSTFNSLEEVFAKTLEHEQYVTSLIFGLMDVATAEKDYKSVQFLQWYVSEQMEEEENATALVEKYKMAKVSDAGVLFLDKEAATRVYSQPLQLANK